jgi:hypothetical protein
MRRAVITGFVVLSLLADGCKRRPSPQERYDADVKVLKLDRDGTPGGVGDSEGAVAALGDMWGAVGDEAVMVMHGDRKASAAEVDHALCALQHQEPCEQQSLEGGDTRELAPGLFAITSFVNEIGSVMVVGRRWNGARVLWSIATAGPQAVDKEHVLDAWRAGQAKESCREKAHEEGWGRCGPMFGRVNVLPPDARGRPRFYVVGEYAQAMGFTVGMQTSVWRWDTDHAELLWIGSYGAMIDSELRDTFEDEVLRLGEKEDYRTFFSCGMCEGREVWQRLKITPDGVEDMGKVAVHPELDLVDELFVRLSEGKATEDIATPEVARKLRPLFPKPGADGVSFGMFENDTAMVQGGKSMCFTADEIGRLYFTLRDRPGRLPLITRVRLGGWNYKPCKEAVEWIGERGPSIKAPR